MGSDDELVALAEILDESGMPFPLCMEVRHTPTGGSRDLRKIGHFLREALGLPQLQQSDEPVLEDAVVGPCTGTDREEMEADVHSSIL